MRDTGKAVGNDFNFIFLRHKDLKQNWEKAAFSNLPVEVNCKQLTHVPSGIFAAAAPGIGWKDIEKLLRKELTEQIIDLLGPVWLVNILEFSFDQKHDNALWIYDKLKEQKELVEKNEI